MTGHKKNTHKARARVSNACQRCREHKVRCSGGSPCKTCHNRGLPCTYAAEERKVAISESTLRDLQRQSHELGLLRQSIEHTRCSSESSLSEQQSECEGQATSEIQQISQIPQISQIRQAEIAAPLPQTQHEEADTFTEGNDPPHEDVSANFSNPLVTEHPEYILDDLGRLRFLGHSSTWAFTQQLLYKIHRNPHFASDAQMTVAHEASIYLVDVDKPPPTSHDFTGLPSFEVAMFYVQTVKFKTQPLYYLFQEDDFVFNLRQFYKEMTAFARRSHIWFVHYLVIMALGKTFNSRNKTMVAGLPLFSRALRLLPDVSTLCGDPVPSTELLLSAAIYFQSIDHRMAAHVYIGQALRLAQAYGMHTGMQTSLVPTELALRGCRIWWTVFTLDRIFAASFGVSSSIRDEDMMAPFPSSMDSSDAAIGQDIHIKICRLLGRILNTVYSSKESLRHIFLATVQDLLRGAAALIDDLTQFSERCVGEISRLSSHLKLSYHQCIILTSRPFLFHLLSRRLESSSPTLTLRLSSAVKGVLQVCLDSAGQISSTLGQLKDHDLLDIFLPLDLECAASAALVHVIASILCPKLLPSTDWLRVCYDVFDHMQERGNALASVRKSEVEQLAHIRVRSELISAQRKHTGVVESTASMNAPPLPPAGRTAHPTPTATVVTEGSYLSLPSLDPFFEDWLMEDGLNEAQIMELANSLKPQDFDF